LFYGNPHPSRVCACWQVFRVMVPRRSSEVDFFPSVGPSTPGFVFFSHCSFFSALFRYGALVSFFFEQCLPPSPPTPPFFARLTHRVTTLFFSSTGFFSPVNAPCQPGPGLPPWGEPLKLPSPFSLIAVCSSVAPLEVPPVAPSSVTRE